MRPRLFNILAILSSLSLMLSACGAPGAGKELRSSRQRELHPAPRQDDVERLVAGNNAFAIDLYRSLRSKEGNLVYSPFSISLALGMTYAGARGTTESQMRETLHFPSDQASTHTAFNALDLALENPQKTGTSDQMPLQLNIANAVWAEETFSFLPDFLDTLEVNYGAGVRLADFITGSEAVREEINQWVEDNTGQKIRDIIPPDAFNPDTRMALVNAIYFKADWQDQFDPNVTSDMPFHLLDGKEIPTPAMHQKMYIPYTKGDGWQLVELSYAGETAGMDILVPDEGRFEELESSLSTETVKGMLAGLTPADLDISLPKFKFESSFGLPDQLSALGMPDAFERSVADFSGMTGGKDLFISSVLHKAMVAVDEKGTEAAAATAVIMAPTSAQFAPLTLKIDRPFIFLIRDLQTGQILFMGRVLNPAG